MQQGDFTAAIKFDARAGRFFKRDRDINGQADWFEIPLPFQSVWDMEHLEVGWIGFLGNVPNFLMVPLGKPWPPQPAQLDDKGKQVFRQGFRVRIFAPKALGGLREFSHTARGVIEAVDALHDAYLKGREETPGRLPVVTVREVTAIKSPMSGGQVQTNYAPRFEITRWVERPEGLTVVEHRPAAATGGAPGNGAAAAGPAAPVGRARAAAPKAEPLLDDEFNDDIPFGDEATSATKPAGAASAPSEEETEF
jgi:hypothetical protein